jgi:hypothetical protein
MPEVIACPRCGRRLSLPVGLLGQTVQCPSCRTTFTADLNRALPTRPTPVPESPAARKVPLAPDPKRRADADRDRVAWPGAGQPDDFRPDFVEPHRGGIILVLGVLGLCLSWFPPTGWLLGGFAAGMAKNDRDRMGLGRMDRAGRGLTVAGAVCGQLAVILSSLVFLVWCVFQFVV